MHPSLCQFPNLNFKYSPTLNFPRQTKNKPNNMAMSTLINSNLTTTSKSTTQSLLTVRANQQFAIELPNHNKLLKLVPATLHAAESLSHLLHLHIETPPRTNFICDWDLICEKNNNSPPFSPREVIADKWQEFHGSKDWNNLLEPLQPWLRREIIKYGEFAQATYDAFDFDSFSEYCGSCRYNCNKIFDVLGLGKNEYNVTKYFYAMSHIDVPKWLKRTSLVDMWSKDSNWMGYVAISNDKETHRIGRRDIVVAWRGTVAPSEWYKDFQREMHPFGRGDAKVEHGFYNIYTSKSDKTMYNKSSASEQVMKEVKRLVQMFKAKGEQVSLTITGHSLGGALALLNAYEAASSLPGLPIRVISFGAPRVGNVDFRDDLEKMAVKISRVVVEQDLVPNSLGLFINEGLGSANWIYTHVGAELRLSVESSPFLKLGFNPLGCHSLETYLHLVDGYHSKCSGFRVDARRDIALVNKACDMLIDELRIPHCWYQLANKGLVCNAHGRWVKPKRDPEDIPSPTSDMYDEIELGFDEYSFAS